MWIKTNKQTAEYQPAPAFGIGHFPLVLKSISEFILGRHNLHKVKRGLMLKLKLQYFGHLM